MRVFTILFIFLLEKRCHTTMLLEEKAWLPWKTVIEIRRKQVVCGYVSE